MTRVMDARLPDNLQERLDGLLESDGSATMGEVLAYQREHLAYVLQHYGRYTGFFELCFALFAEIIDGLNYADKSRWPKHRGTQLILFLHNLKTLESAEDRLVKGCYGDALVLLRVPYEAFLRMVFMSMFPADAMSALATPEPRHRAFNATNLITQDLHLPWTDHTLLSVFAHAHRSTALSHVIDIAARGRRDPVALEYHFDEEHFTLGANLLSIVCYMCLGMVVQMFGRDVTAPRGLVDRIGKASAVAEVLGAMLRTHRRQYLPAVVDDIDDVLRMMRAADDGKHWQFAWSRIRLMRVLSRMLACRKEPAPFQ
jgi:hypothetical protein